MCRTRDLSVRRELEISRQLRAQRGGRSGARLTLGKEQMVPEEDAKAATDIVDAVIGGKLSELELEEIAVAIRDDRQYWGAANPTELAQRLLATLVADRINAVMSKDPERVAESGASAPSESAALRSSRRTPEVERELRLSRELRSKRHR